MYTLPRYRYVKSSSPLFLRRCRYDDGWREGSHVRNDSLNGGRVSIDRSIGALYQLGCGQAGVQSEYNCRIFSADHTLHILRADIYVGIMFGMLMRSLGSPPFPLFRSAPLAHTLFPQFFDTSKHLGRCVYIYICRSISFRTRFERFLESSSIDVSLSPRSYRTTLRYVRYNKIDRSSRNRRPSLDTLLPLFLDCYFTVYRFDDLYEARPNDII